MAHPGRKLLLITALACLGWALFQWLPRGRKVIPDAELARLAAQNERIYHLDRALILAVVANESHGDAWAQSSAGAMGLMQLLPGTGADLAARHQLPGDLRDPAQNMALGCAYLRELGDRFGDQPDLVIAAYHAGPTRVQQWQKANPRLSVQELIRQNAGPQTRAYVDNVKATWLAYKKQTDKTLAVQQ